LVEYENCKNYMILNTYAIISAYAYITLKLRDFETANMLVS